MNRSLLPLCGALLLAAAGMVRAQLGLPLQLPGSAPAAVPPQGAGPSTGSFRPRALKAWISADELKKKNRWERTRADAPLPWIAPGQRVEAYRRKARGFDDDDRDEIRWHVGERLGYPRYAYDYTISDFVLEDPVSRDWNHLGETMTRPDESSSRDIVISPYRLYLIAVEPTVVVMMPYRQVPKPEHAWNGPRKTLDADDAAIDHDDFRYATVIPPRDGLMWLSPSAKIRATPLKFDDAGVARFDAGAHSFKCTRDAQAVNCTREAASKPAP